MSKELASKADILALEHKLYGEIKSVRAEMSAVRNELIGKIETVEARLFGEIKAVEARLFGEFAV